MLAEIVAERADVRTLRAADAQHMVRAAPLQIVDGVHRDGARRALHLAAAAGDVIELLPVNFDGAVHRRELGKLAGKARQCRTDVLF